MNKFIYRTSVGLILLKGTVILYEIVTSSYYLRKMRVDNEMMMKFIESSRYQNILEKRLANGITLCIYDLVATFLLYILLEIFNNLLFFDEYIQKNVDEEVLQEENSLRPSNGMISFFSKFITSKNRFLYFISFITLCIIVRSKGKELNIFINLLYGLLFFWFYLKITVWFFKKLGVYIAAVNWGFLYFSTMESKLFLFETLDAIEDPESIVPQEIIQHLKEKGIEFKFYELYKEKKFFNLGVYSEGNSARFVLIGEYNKLTRNELIASLYHEIGHVLNNSKKNANIISVINTFLSMVLGITYMMQSRKIDFQCFSTEEAYFFYECFSISFSTNICNVITNIFKQFDEAFCDEYSKRNFPPHHLASSLLKLEFMTYSPLTLTTPYSFLHYDHPITISRIRNLGFQ